MTLRLPLHLPRAEINRRALATEHLVADLSRGTARGGAIAVGISLARTKRMFQWSLIRTPLMIAAFLVGLPFGGLGLAVAFTSVVIATFLPGLAFATRGTPIGVRQILRIVAPPSLAGMAAAGCGTLAAIAATAGSNLQSLAAAGSGAALVYLVTAGTLIWFDPELRRVRQRLIGHVGIADGRATRVQAAISRLRKAPSGRAGWHCEP